MFTAKIQGSPPKQAAGLGMGPLFVEDVVSSLVREFLHRKGFKKTSLVLDQEHPRGEYSINNRNELRKVLHLEMLYKENKTTTLRLSPFPTRRFFITDGQFFPRGPFLPLLRKSASAPFHPCLSPSIISVTRCLAQMSKCYTYLKISKEKSSENVITSYFLDRSGKNSYNLIQETPLSIVSASKMYNKLPLKCSENSAVNNNNSSEVSDEDGKTRYRMALVIMGHTEPAPSLGNAFPAALGLHLKVSGGDTILTKALFVPAFPAKCAPASFLRKEKMGAAPTVRRALGWGLYTRSLQKDAPNSGI
ncbi:uncharacterized protein LOC127549625 [Antechinus flavipes]|uniref:uncharacterized protein LOC127549625 n=1 Tax=Antechinus flavipes TaxID=38775 RepID=UPI002235790B|nr:uncharacterized protein LOC127549625 [Antechinus flavipes]